MQDRIPRTRQPGPGVYSVCANCGGANEAHYPGCTVDHSERSGSAFALAFAMCVLSALGLALAVFS